MNSISYAIYRNIPYWLQNIVISIYGYKIDRVRHGSHYHNHFNSIKNNVFLPEQKLKEYQFSELKKLLYECRNNIPYYRNLFIQNNIDVDDIDSLSDLKKIPFLEKGIVRANADLLVNEKYQKEKLTVIQTTGTTGTPLKIYCDSLCRQKNYSFYRRFLEMNGIDYRDKRATFGGRIVVDNYKGGYPYWRYSYFQKNLLFSSYHINDKTIKMYIDKLIEFRPHYIDSYPSSIYELASYAYNNKLDLHNVVKGITTSAETLYDEQRYIIEHVFGVPVIDQYGSAEMCIFIGQCSSGRYHVHSDYAIVEFLREDGSIAKNGEEAEIVCTGLINPIMPFLRYRIGDKAIVSDERCPCGCAFPVVEKVLGRVDDCVVTPEGNRIGRLSPVLKGFPVKEAQYVQTSPEMLTVRLVRDQGFTAESEKKIELALRSRLGMGIQICFVYVEGIDRGPGAKRKTVISMVR